MTSLSTILTGTKPGPRRILLYGQAGSGKSSWASCASAPIFLQTEDGLNDIDCHKFPVATSFDTCMQSLGALYHEDHPYRTVVIDSLDWLERLIWAKVCAARQVATIEDIGYGKGYAFALQHWRDVLDGLTALREHRGMTVILIAHARIERFENPETDAYDRYVPRLHKTAAAMIAEWCDEVLFATYKVFTKSTDEGFNQKRVQGLGSGERVLRTTERPSHLAKNRLNLPDELPLVWSHFAKHITANNAIVAASTTVPTNA
jgi:AAA domain